VARIRDIRLKVPAPRRSGCFAVWRAIWTAPTTLLGHLAARAMGCGPPEPIGGPAAAAHLYRLPPGRCRRCSAIAIGHVVIVQPALLDRLGPWLLAHELSHVRQHDWLGPLYLPAHALAQAASIAMSLIRPVAGLTPWHAHNPLERRLLCVPIDVLAVPHFPTGPHADAVLAGFGLAPAMSSSKSNNTS
jgi:hypothetical protein